jgi:hypothetical protein
MFVADLSEGKPLSSGILTRKYSSPLLLTNFFVAKAEFCLCEDIQIIFLSAEGSFFWFPPFFPLSKNIWPLPT